MRIAIQELSRDTSETGVRGDTAVFYSEVVSLGNLDTAAISDEILPAQVVGLYRIMTLNYCLGCKAQVLGKCQSADIDIAGVEARVLARGEEGVFDSEYAACQDITDSR